MKFRSFLMVAMIATQVPILYSQVLPDQRPRIQSRRTAAQPGKEHEQLKQLAGSWKVAMTVGGKPFDYQGNATAETILGDRFLVIDGDGMTGKQAGNHRSAYRFTIGFDRWDGEYVIILLDTSGTHQITARGAHTDGQIRTRVPGDDPNRKMGGYGTRKLGFDLDIVSHDEFSIGTILVDGTEKQLPNISFRYIFQRANATAD